MSTRSDLLTQITTNITGSNISVSQELPWTASGESLYLKNMKHFYMDEEQDDNNSTQLTTDIADDVITYTFEFNFITI